MCRYWIVLNHVIAQINKLMMNIFIKKHWLSITGAVIGALGGFAYYYFVGCQTGTCPIKSNPYGMTIWGAVMGYLILSMFEKKDRGTNNKE